MTSPEQRPLPNAADKASLKAMAATVVQMCPGLHDEAHQVARELLERKHLKGIDPTGSISIDSNLRKAAPARLPAGSTSAKSPTNR